MPFEKKKTDTDIDKGSLKVIQIQNLIVFRIRK
jgi:hypothetical protein